MKILIMSDSHGSTSTMLSAALVEKPDMILHLGDHHTDCQIFHNELPEIPLRTVKGNCDTAGAPETADFICEGLHIMMTHGHRFNVKYSLDSLITNAMYNDADILLFGHTHIPCYNKLDRLHIINPGSIHAGKNPTYGILSIDSGTVQYELKSIK